MIEDEEASDLLSDETLDISFMSESEDEPQSVNIDLSNGSPLNDKDFTVLHFNINSITAEGRLEELSIVCDTIKVDVLILTESKLSETIPTNIVTISGYHEPLRRDRTRHGGGVLVYISESLTYEHKTELQSEKFEHIWADIRVKEKLYSINAFYRPPNESNESHTEFLVETELILTRLNNHPSHNKIIASDLNFGNCFSKFPILPPKPLDSTAPQLFASHGFKELIDIPTRITETTTSLIDLIFVTNQDFIQKHGTLPKIADHDGVFVSFHCSQTKQKPITRIIYDYKNADEKGLVDFIKNYDYNSAIFSRPVIEQAEAFTNVLTEAFTKFVPTKKVTVRIHDQPWCNSYTRLLLRRKNRNYQLFKKVNSEYLAITAKTNVAHEIVTKLKNKKETLSKKARDSANESLKANRRAKTSFYSSVNSIMHNYSISAKKKFSILTKLMKNQKNSSVPPLIEAEQTVNDPQTKSNIFNDLFASKATVAGADDPVPPLKIKDDILSQLSQINTSPIEVAQIIRTIKKSNSSFCGVPGKFLSLISTPVSFPLYKIFNNLFKIGHFPDIWKLAHITAIWKRNGLKSSKLNYRPISLLPTLSKVCESIIHRRLLSHFTDNNIISERQAAYLKGDSTIQQLLYIIHLIRTSWSKGNITQGVFLDVSAAFDKCWHSGLLAKLEQVQVNDSCLDLFRSYLSGRKQVVVVDGCMSDMKDVKAGVPQGSRLGPLLWVLYVQDILEDLESEVLLFADDTCCFASAKDPSETAAILNRDLAKISEWAKKWKVTFNPSKTKDIIFSNKFLFNSPPIIFNNTFVSRVVEHKHLGVWLSASLEWSRQVHETSLKANGKLAVLRSVRFLNRSTLDVLYKLTVRSVIDYSLVLYYHTLSATQVAKLNQIQYRAAKLCTGALHFTSQEKLNTELGWEDLGTRAEFLGLSIFHKIHLHETRPLIRKCMPGVLKPKAKNTRTKNNFYEPFPHLGKNFSNSFFPHFTIAWNNLEIPLQTEKDQSVFKDKLKLKFKPKRHKHFARGSKRGNSLLTQLRVGRTFLNSHGFSIGLAESPACVCDRNETVEHYMLKCFLYAEERQILFSTVEQLLPNFRKMTQRKQLYVLLYGINLDIDVVDSRNLPLTFAVQKFLLTTNRL